MEGRSVVISSNFQGNKEQSSSPDSGLNLGLVDFPLLNPNGGKEDNPRRAPTLQTNFRENHVDDWSSLFPNKKNAEENPLIYQSPVMMEGMKAVSISSEILHQKLKECKELAIGYFIGRKLSYSMVKDAAAKVWMTKSEVSITLHSSNSFVFKFLNSEDRNLALDHGAFYISGSFFFVVRPWSPLIENSIAEMKSIHVWMLIYNVPIHLWNNLGLVLIASFVGKPLMIDDCTINKTRLSYARVLVEINFDCQFPSAIPLWIYGKFKANGKAHSNPKKKQNSEMLKGFQSLSKEGEIEKAGEDIGISEETNPSTYIDEQPNQQIQIVGEGVLAKAADIGKQVEEPFIKSRTYARRIKSSSKKGNKQIPICNLNPYSVLGAVSETVLEELLKSARENSEDHNEDKSHVNEEHDIEEPIVYSCEGEESEYETDNDVVGVAKVMSVEEVSQWKPMTKEQNLDKLLKFSSSIGLSRGSKEVEVKKIFGGIVDTFHSSKPIKYLGPSNDNLGRGKRTPIPKKKL
ncbi:uncharacterized protein LOC113345235 [Papaver somniferum]|uniref:uncharacterized protein LOC113345235 n=1 Tax=Papaver somniferum TaxID=3469 RepID=UPI000E6F878D|nr:uncharacterized protein LOC113345235 [Papaver somniferum]